MSEANGATTGGKQIWVRGHEIVVTTSRDAAGGFYSFALLTTDVEGTKGMKGFKANGPSARGSELACIDRVLQFLEDRPAGPAPPRARASRNVASIRGRDVDIFCDLVGDGRYQAFPFLYDDAGRRQILMYFHLEEAVTADTAEEARLRCVRRLEAYFDAVDAGREPGLP